MFEVDKDQFSPRSPPLTATAVSKNAAVRGEAARLIRNECERFVCKTIRAVFLGEGNVAMRSSLEMDVQTNSTADTSYGSLGGISRSSSIDDGGYLLGSRTNTELSISSGSSARIMNEATGLVQAWFEMWEYKENCRFRGFIAENEEEKALFVFFDENAFGGGLKPGMMALLELAETPGIDCSHVYICLDKRLAKKDYECLVKDLRWVGFSLTTLADWTVYSDITSDRWTFLSMEVE